MYRVFKSSNDFFKLSIQTAIMPIGPCEPNNYLRYSHINAEEAGEAFLTLKAKQFIPMHWGTFGFGVDRPLQPLHRIEEWWTRTFHNITSDCTLIPLRIGQHVATSVIHCMSIPHVEEKATASML